VPVPLASSAATEAAAGATLASGPGGRGQLVDGAGDRAQLRHVAEVRVHEDQPDIPDQPAQQGAQGRFGLRVAEPRERFMHKQKVTE